MNRLLHRLLAFLLLVSASAGAQMPAAADPFAPIAHWVGGQWVASLKTQNGDEIRLIRSYEWTFDRRALIGRSFGERAGKRVQTRFTLFVWNPEAKRIEFTDLIDQGGYGSGFVEAREGGLYMEARIVGNDKHPPWRAWVSTDADGAESFRIEAEQKGAWTSFGTWVYRREP
jgi:hypothetical protein